MAAVGDPGTFAYTIVGNTAPNCGVSITPDRPINIHPVSDWFGFSIVTIEVSDGVNSHQQSFRITVHPLGDPAAFAPFELDLRHSTIDADGDGLSIGDEAG